jgi:hypothetical protein
MIEPIPIFGTTTRNIGTARAYSETNPNGVKYCEIFGNVFEIGLEEIAQNGDTIRVEGWDDGYYGTATLVLDIDDPPSNFCDLTMSSYSGSYIKSKENDISTILKYITSKEIGEISNVYSTLFGDASYIKRTRGSDGVTLSISVLEPLYSFMNHNKNKYEDLRNMISDEIEFDGTDYVLLDVRGNYTCKTILYLDLTMLEVM